MYNLIINLVLEHSVALAILIANIVAAIIISKRASHDIILQNKYQDNKNTTAILFQILEDLQTIEYECSSNSNQDSHALLKKTSLKIILNCKKAMHMLSRCKIITPNIAITCNDIHNFLCSNKISDMQPVQAAKKIYTLNAQLSKNIKNDLY